MNGQDGKSNLGQQLRALLETVFVNPTPDDAFTSLFQPDALLAVFEKQFSTTPSKGVDRLDGFQFHGRAKEILTVVSKKCLDGSFRFSPYLESLKSKGRNSPPRLISIPTIRDRIVLHQLNKVIATGFPNSVPKNIANAYLREIIDDLRQKKSKVFVCGCDIKTFYDSIQRDRLVAVLQKKLNNERIVKLIRHAISTPTVPKNAKRKAHKQFSAAKGVPQGLAISNILASVYLEEVDAAMKKMDVKYYRYVDDVLMYGNEESVRGAHRSLAARLRVRGLGVHKLGTGKSHVGPLNEPFGYLGYYFSWPKVTVRDASIERLLQSIAAKFSDYLHNKSRRLERYKYLDEARLSEIFLLELNERIGGAISAKRRYGWIAYYGQITDLNLLHRLDYAVADMFSRLSEFGHKSPEGLKKFRRAYFEMKFNPQGNYVRNYDRIEARGEKLNFLVERGRIGPDEQLTDEQITSRFDAYRRFVLAGMQADEQLVY